MIPFLDLLFAAGAGVLLTAGITVLAYPTHLEVLQGEWECFREHIAFENVRVYEHICTSGEHDTMDAKHIRFRPLTRGHSAHN